VKRHKISTYSAHSDNCYFHFSICCLIELKFCEISWNPFSNRCWKFQLSILKNKKVLFLKIYFFGPCQYQNKKALFTDSIFREGFELDIVMFPFPHNEMQINPKYFDLNFCNIKSSNATLFLSIQWDANRLILINLTWIFAVCIKYSNVTLFF
jgi:hypothetical protein